MNRDMQCSYGVCGLNCNRCQDKINHECHGCECPGHDCAAAWHQKHCRIYQCARGRGYVTCADCPDLPCSMLNAFCCDLQWPDHLQCPGNLQRIRRIGLEAWIAEQSAYWSDPRIHQ